MNRFVCNSELKPRRATKYSAAYDFISPADFVVPGHGECLIETGVAIELDDDKVLMLFVRSSYGFKYGITLSNGTGIIDKDFFPNTMKCKLRNDSDKDFIIHKGDHYMQGIIINYFKTIDDDTETIRTGGIGSTGK